MTAPPPTLQAGPHRCPGPGCNEQVPHDQLACPRHWFQVPMAYRRAVSRAWAYGAGEGSPEHRQACAAAIEFMTA